MSQGSTHASVHDCVFFFRIRRRGSVTPDNPEPPRRTVSHPINQYVDVAVDHTGKSSMLVCFCLSSMLVCIIDGAVVLILQLAN